LAGRPMEPVELPRWLLLRWLSMDMLPKALIGSDQIGLARAGQAQLNVRPSRFDGRVRGNARAARSRSTVITDVHPAEIADRIVDEEQSPVVANIQSAK